MLPEIERDWLFTGGGRKEALDAAGLSVTDLIEEQVRKPGHYREVCPWRCSWFLFMDNNGCFKHCFHKSGGDDSFGELQNSRRRDTYIVYIQYMFARNLLYRYRWTT